MVPFFQRKEFRLKISVITPSFNQGEFLERTICSVLDQNYSELEFIVMDGGSNDNSLDVIEKYAPYITHFESKPDGGQTKAVNKGISLSTGDVIGWLNSDDVYYPKALETVAETFDRYPEINVIYGKADHIDEDDKIIEPYYAESWDYQKLKRICYICQPAVFLRKSMVDKHGLLDESLDFCMDYEYWLRLGQYQEFYFCEKILAGSRLYPSNKTLGSRLKVHVEIVKMFKEKFGQVPRRWLAAQAHYKAIEGTKSTIGPWALRKYLLKTIFHWNKDMFLMNRQVMPKELLSDFLSVVKGNSDDILKRMAISQYE